MNPPTPSSRLFQIHEEDLEVLERELPELMQFATSSPHWNERKDRQEAWQMVQKIISSVRWGYGPPSEIHEAP